MVEVFLLLELSAITITLAFLAYASWLDWRFREVDDKVWLIYGPVGASLTLGRLFLAGFPSPLLWAVSLAIALGLALALYYGGLWGGADSKALICLALTLPTYPLFANPILGLWLIVFPLTVVFNAFLLSLLTIAYILLRNLAYKLSGGKLFEGFEAEPPWKKFLALLTSFKVKREKLTGNPALTLAEKAFEKGRTWIFRLQIGESGVEDVGKLPEEVWVTPQLPFLLFLTLGVAVALTLGDLALTLISLLLSSFNAV